MKTDFEQERERERERGRENERENEREAARTRQSIPSCTPRRATAKVSDQQSARDAADSYNECVACQDQVKARAIRRIEMDAHRVRIQTNMPIIVYQQLC